MQISDMIGINGSRVIDLQPMPIAGFYPVLSVYVLAGALMVLQAPVELPTSLFAQVERTGLLGALMVAVGILWKSNAKKDDQIIALTSQVVAAISSNSDTQKELRKIVEESTTAKSALAHSIESGMLRLPCQMDDASKKKLGM